ncbi:class I SAM-dependent methyltransferase [Nitrincola sp.]|uniref:class I SAM-dependent methyltransferase n=1 Tax=Nitrincola sp. TaxID=1926584 RepID=UPI003A9585B6
MSQAQHISAEGLTEGLKDWFASPLGQEIAACERQMADQLIHTAFGYHLVQIGYDASVKLYEPSPVSHKVMLCPRMSLGMDEHTIIAQPHELPLPDSTMDVVILHHTLDFADQPHQVLREASRVLRPGGHMLIVSFNPTSFWGICRRSKRGARVPWVAHGFSHWRLNDWVRLLDLTELKSVSAFHRPPLENERWRKRMGFLEKWVSRFPTYSGVVLMMLIRKDVAGVTPLKPAWKTRKLIPFPVAEPSARNKTARGKSV